MKEEPYAQILLCDGVGDFTTGMFRHLHSGYVESAYEYTHDHRHTHNYIYADDHINGNEDTHHHTYNNDRAYPNTGSESADRHIYTYSHFCGR